MGLDMYLYRVSKPEAIAEGDRIDCDMQLSIDKREIIDLFPVDAPELCDTVRKNSVMCFAEEREVLYDRILADFFMLIGAKPKSAEKYASAFRSHGADRKGNISYMRFSATDKKAMKLLSQCCANGDNGEEASFVLENTGKFNIVCRVRDSESIYGNEKIIYVEQQKLCEEDICYEGKYTVSEWPQKYAFKLTELAYQRNKLNGDGAALLPENCYFCEDKERVRQMTAEGLSREFIEKWEDGVTVFYYWW